MLVSYVLTGLKLYLNHKYLFELIFRNIVYKLQAEAVKSNHFHVNLVRSLLSTYIVLE